MLKLKNSIKLIIALSFIIALGLAFGTTKVEAVELSEEYFESLINELPKEMSVDIPEVEYEKARGILHDKVIAILKDKGFELEGINISILDVGYNIYLGKDDFHSFRIHLYNDDGTVRYTSGSIKLTYNNTNNYNSADEESVKNITLPESPEYFVFDLDEYENLISQGESSWNAVLKIVSSYYQGYNDDETVKFVASSGLGTFDPLNFEIGDLTIGIFKNGIFYDIRRMENFDAVCRIYIPKEINNTAEDYIKYAKPIIEDSFDIENATITKGAKLLNETEIKNGYTINGYGKIILEEMPTSIINSEDEKTNVKLETTNDVVPADTKLVVEEITTGKEYTTVQNVLKEETTKMVVYDITLLSNNVEIQPNGNVKISLPIPSDYNKENIIVYRVEDNGTKTEYNVKVDGNYATFETDHFSTYVLAEKKVEDTNTKTETPTINNDNKELDETPKTGENNITNVICLTAIVLSVAGIAIIKKYIK